MTRVSKNIKRLRVQKGFTQDGLAERVHVTRQTVSSWETGRTQPDLDMLLLLSEALDAPAEALLYGEKRNTSLDAPPTYRNTVRIVFTVLASLFIAAGLLLVFLNGWESLPVPVRYVCSFLPLLLSQGFALWVFFRRKDRLPLLEGAGVLWTLGILAAMAMLCSLQQHTPDFPVLALLAAFMLLPVFLLLRAVTALLCCFAAISAFGFWGFYEATEWALLQPFTPQMYMLLYFLLFTVCAAAGLGCAVWGLRNIDPQRKRIGFWLCLLFCGAFVTGSAAILETSIFGALFSFAVSLFLLDGFGKRQGLSSRYVGLTAAMVMLLILSAGALFDVSSHWQFLPVMLLSYALIGSLPLTAVVCNRRILVKDPVRLIQTGLFLAALVLILVLEATRNSAETARAVTFQLLTFVLSVLLMVEGAKENALFKINLGFLSVCTLAVFLIWQADFKLYLKGLILLGFGLLLLLVNRWALARKQKKAEERQVTDDEA